MVIVSCPNCDARYKLSDAVLARGARLKCTACDHRWIPAAPAPPPERAATTAADEDARFGAAPAPRPEPTPEPIDTRWADDIAPSSGMIAPEMPPAPADANAGATDNATDDDADDATDNAQPDAGHAPALLRTLFAALAGIALSIIAAGLWVGRVDLSDTPYVGAALARLSPPQTLAISVTGTTTALPSGRLLLEVKGVIRNTGTATADVPDLRASLSGPSGVALRWTIVPQIRRLPAGGKTEYSSTVTGFPPDARSVAISPARSRLF